MRAFIALQRRLGEVGFEAVGLAGLDEGCHVIYEQGRVRFVRRAEVGFYAEVESHLSITEPGSAALGEFRRLGDFIHTENPTVKSPRFFLSSGGHGKLEMVKG